VIVTAPADPTVARPSAMSTEKQKAILNTRVEPLALTPEPSSVSG
jgi:hypothetical protein